MISVHAGLVALGHAWLVAVLLICGYPVVVDACTGSETHSSE